MAGFDSPHKGKYTSYNNQDFQQLRRTNPSTFYRVEVQRQMVEARQQQGEKFYSDRSKTPTKADALKSILAELESNQ